LENSELLLALCSIKIVYRLLTIFIVCCFAAEGYAADGPNLQVGAVVLRPLQAAEIPAQQTGLLRAVAVVEGQRVESGQLLATLDDREAKLEVVQAKIEHAQAEAKANNQVHIQYAVKALEVARAELRRSKESIEEFAKSISQSQLDVERLKVEKLTLEQQQAEHELALARFDQQLTQNLLEAAQLRLKLHRIEAPFAGRVVLVRGRVGEWVEVGAPVMRLVATDKLRAEGFMPADIASASLVGSRVLLRVESQEEPVAGVLRFVSPELDVVTRQVRVWGEIPNTEGLLRSGEQGVMEIVERGKGKGGRGSRTP